MLILLFVELNGRPLRLNGFYRPSQGTSVGLDLTLFAFFLLSLARRFIMIITIYRPTRSGTKVFDPAILE